MSGLPRIQSVPLEEKHSALSVMLLAFSGDPFFRWFIPEPAKYVEGGIALMNAFGGGKAIENGTAFAPSNYEGASFWLPPGVSIDEQLVGLIKVAHKHIIMTIVVDVPNSNAPGAPTLRRIRPLEAGVFEVHNRLQARVRGLQPVGHTGAQMRRLGLNHRM